MAKSDKSDFSNILGDINSFISYFQKINAVYILIPGIKNCIVRYIFQLYLL